ncbi:MAG TPA: helix-turn-helix transcriptional regulator [Flavisolibacter sp.]|nr:helix-turn-helix transcriptional regulator [Flavisolibacter sp.]
MRIRGETLRLWRNMKNLNQAGVAKTLGNTEQAYSKWERKDLINGECLERFLAAMDCTLERLFEIQKKFLPPPPPNKNL